MSLTKILGKSSSSSKGNFLGEQISLFLILICLSFPPYINHIKSIEVSYTIISAYNKQNKEKFKDKFYIIYHIPNTFIY